MITKLTRLEECGFHLYWDDVNRIWEIWSLHEEDDYMSSSVDKDALIDAAYAHLFERHGIHI